MNISDYIATIAALVAFLSAYYTRHARDAARKANQIATRESRRPLRLAVYQAAALFSRYCGQYLTLQCIGQAKGTRELVARIDTFKWEVEQHGPLNMPEVERRIEELIKAAWRLQRLLDRLAGGQNESNEPVYATAEENREAVSDWFAEQDRELKELFGPYLAEA